MESILLKKSRPKAAVYVYEVDGTTNPPAAVAGSFVTVPFNTERFNNIGATIESNIITIPAGNYVFRYYSATYRGGRLLTELMANNSGVDVSTVGWSNTTSNAASGGYLTTGATFTEETEIYLRHYLTYSNSSFNHGLIGSTAGNSVYFVLEIQKLP